MLSEVASANVKCKCWTSVGIVKNWQRIEPPLCLYHISKLIRGTLKIFYLSYQILYHFFCIAEEHRGFWSEEEIVLDTCITWLHASFIDDNIFGKFNIKYRHSVNRRSRIRFGSRIYHIICPQHKNYIRCRKLFIRLLHLLQFLVTHIGFCE